VRVQLTHAEGTTDMKYSSGVSKVTKAKRRMRWLQFDPCWIPVQPLQYVWDRALKVRVGPLGFLQHSVRPLDPSPHGPRFLSYRRLFQISVFIDIILKMRHGENGSTMLSLHVGHGEWIKKSKRRHYLGLRIEENGWNSWLILKNSTRRLLTVLVDNDFLFLKLSSSQTILFLRLR